MPALSKSAARMLAAANELKKVLEKDKLSRKASRKFAAFFRAQKALVLAQLESKLKPHFPEPSEAKTQKAPLPKDLEKIWNLIWDSVYEDTTGTLQKLILSTEEEGMIKGALQLPTTISPKDKNTWDLENPRAVKWFEETGGSTEYIKGIQDTTQSELQTLIENALAEGKSYTKLEKEIKDRFDEYSELLPGKDMSRAELIAINEIGNAYEEGSMQFAQGLAADGVEMEKRWVTVGDNNVSDGCLENGAVDWIPIDDAFPSGDDRPLRFPGCRCYAVYREKGKVY
jgi:uncharacterized protein with gpF-like domain